MSDDRYQVVEVADVSGWDDAADVVIAGLGCAGVCAAIEARATGAEVLVIERASGGGGITSSAAGHLYLGGGTRVQRAVGVDDSVEDMRSYLVHNTPEPDLAKIDLYCEQSVSHFDWLVEQGVPFNDTMFPTKHVLQPTDECLIWSGNEEAWPYREHARPAPRGHKVAQEGEHGGAKLMEVLIERAAALGVRVVCEAALTGLVRDGDRIVGARYSDLDGVRWVRARRGLILATGHFTGNDAMIEEHCAQLADERVYRQYTPNDDGSGIQLGVAAGGEALHMGGALITCPFYPPEQLLKAVLVNREGRRFVAEDSYHSRTSAMITQQPDAVAYLIVDEKVFARPEWGGFDVIDAWESYEEMERGLGLPEGALVDTMRAYNEHAAKGEDPELHKGSKWLTPLDAPPFAALDASLSSNGFVGFTLGGLRVSADGEVQRPDGTPIPGLYAAGACASNIAQDALGYSSGTCIGESTFFGRRAGRRASGRPRQ